MKCLLILMILIGCAQAPEQEPYWCEAMETYQPIEIGTPGWVFTPGIKRNPKLKEKPWSLHTLSQ